MNYCTNMMTKSLEDFQEALFTNDISTADKSIADYHNYKAMYDAMTEAT